MATAQTSAEHTAFSRIAKMLRTLRHLAARLQLRARRDRRRSIAHLRSMSDAQLRDIGLTRPQIDRLTRGAANQTWRDAA